MALALFGVLLITFPVSFPALRQLPNFAIRRWAIRAALLGGLVGTASVLRWTVLAPEPTPVRVAAVERGRVEQTVTNSRAGTVRARRRAKLSPQQGGRVVAIPKREGQWVKAGDIVLELDAEIERARLVLAQRDLEAARARRAQACLAAERAARERERNRRLAREGIVSPDLLDKVESAARTAAASCTAARAQQARAAAAVDLARRQLEQMVLRAPFDGIIAEVATEVGEWVMPSPPGLRVPPVIDILDPRSIYVSAPMDEVDSARIHAGLPARVTVDSHPGRTFPGHVVRVAPYVLDIEEQNRTVEIEVELDDQAFASTLLPGTSADVEVILDAHNEVLRVPTGALLAGNKVLVVADGRLVEREVKTGLRNWDYTEIETGLDEGERVVVSLDRPEVRAGARVVIEKEEAS